MTVKIEYHHDYVQLEKNLPGTKEFDASYGGLMKNCCKRRGRAQRRALRGSAVRFAPHNLKEN